MKLLIKISLDSLNIYDILSVVEDFHSKIADTEQTEVCVVLNKKYQDIAEGMGFYFSDETTIPQLINAKLNSYEWDIVLPVFRACSPVEGFDDKIRQKYENTYENLGGILWFYDNEQKNINTVPVVGRKYYEAFGYIYCPSYTVKNFEKEFTEISKKQKAHQFINEVILRPKLFIEDDDNIFNFREKIGFCIPPKIEAPKMATPKIIAPQTTTKEEVIVETPSTTPSNVTIDTPPLTVRKEAPAVLSPLHTNPKHPSIRFRRKYINQ
jgi:hypothetical protein